MSMPLDPDGSKPKEKPAPEQSGAKRPTEQDKSESAGRNFIRGMAEGAGTVLGTTLASAVIIGVTAVGGVVIAETQGGPHQEGGAAVSCIA
ncbi:hypothetical protein [Streptomyces sp. MW-W600-10]|uniref:hypothetical protein n=1 Tax=Streptomyces sp. MW-W600-10 TaxID=2829819 RepID=UPI001C4675E1|nr:hypothetical protein [Streptomyces sp. MW-W600-10]MBV7249203.1 hypothetical protein [Streptomyces sp. MW-W600-10]